MAWVKQSSGTSTTATSNLNGLTIAYLGDSITYASNLTGFDELIAADTGSTALNYGVSSTTVGIRVDRTDSFLERYTSMDASADVIFVLGGTNDFGGLPNVPIGTLGNGDTSTFYGAYEALLDGLITKYPNKPIGIATPMNRKNAPSGLKSYVQAVRDVGEKYSIPVLDLYRDAGLSPINTYHLDNYYVIQDGLHPNNEGYKIVSRSIKSFLERIVG